MKLDDYLESVRAVEKRIEFNAKARAEEAKMTPAMLKAIDALERRVNDFVVPERGEGGRRLEGGGGRGA